MVISFRNHRLQKELTIAKALRRKHGDRRAKLIETRLTQLEAADTLEIVRFLPGPRCHELKGNRAGQLSVDLDHPYRLIFVPDHQPPPSKPSGGLDWSAVTRITILEIADTLSKPHQFDPDYAVPPGRTLQETIDAVGMTQKELALRTGRPLKTINEIIKGVAAITAETALQLEKVTGVPAGFWNNLEANYRERLARLQDRQRLDEQTGWLKQFSYAKMAAMGLVKPTRDRIEKVENLLRYFGVANFKQWEATYSRLQGAAREQDGLRSSLGDLSAWLRAGEILAQRVDCQPYNAVRFEAALTRIRTLTCDPPATVWPEVVRLCADAGVAVVLVPELPKTHVYGFTRWLTSTKALLQLSLRYKTDDLLWFTFFHEAAHILKHGKTDIFFEFRGASDPKEEEANRWSADFLIPPQDWQEFLARVPEPNRHDIVHFARQKKVAPSVVLGRLQHREKRFRPHFYNDLKQRLEIQWNGLNE